MKCLSLFLIAAFISITLTAQPYPQGYFRSPLDIPMQLVANFGEIRPNHWHMGLDIRTQQRVNLPVHAAADGYIARISVEPGGFGQAIYINHPNGYTTVYGHLNAFFPALAQYIKMQQYQQQSWEVDLDIPATMFSVKKGDLIALSGSTGGSQGPHVHFEIRDTKTGNCLNPLLFGFPVPDAVPPSLLRLAMYDRNRSTYEQTPQLFTLKKSGAHYALTGNDIIKTGSNKISFAVGAVDRFTGSANANGIYSAQVLCDNAVVSGFVLNNFDYNKTRYINEQVDYKLKYNKGPYVQHISPLPGDESGIYKTETEGGIIILSDETVHTIIIEVKDAAQNSSRLQFNIQYDAHLAKSYPVATTEKLIPKNVNVFEREGFELYTGESAVYDTVNISYNQTNTTEAHVVSAKNNFCSLAIPVQDAITVRIRPDINLSPEMKERVIIENISGTKTAMAKAQWSGDWVWAKFKQFGSYQALVDSEPPTINAPPANLGKAGKIIFIPKDNSDVESFRAELDGQWLMFTNDKGHAYIYSVDEHFPPGEHELKVIVKDIAGNTTTKVWKVRR